MFWRVKMTLGPIQLPEVLSKSISENKAEIGLKIPNNLAYFEGHFPNFPIVPGVVQLHWAVVFARDIFKVSPMISKGKQIKFSNLMLPFDTLSLVLEHVPDQSLITYTYRNDTKTYATGRLTYSTFKDKNNVL